jgi:hypothetical protein
MESAILMVADPIPCAVTMNVSPDPGNTVATAGFDVDALNGPVDRPLSKAVTVCDCPTRMFKLVGETESSRNTSTPIPPLFGEEYQKYQRFPSGPDATFRATG